MIAHLRIVTPPDRDDAGIGLRGLAGLLTLALQRWTFARRREATPRPG